MVLCIVFEAIVFLLQDPTAVIGEGCRIGPSVVIGPNVVIEDGRLTEHDLQSCTGPGLVRIGFNLQTIKAPPS